MPGFIDKVLRRDVASRIKNIQYLGNVKSAEGIFELIKYLDDENVEIRRAASSALEQHWITGNKDAIIAMTKALKDADSVVRKNSALALGEYVSKSAASAQCDAAKQALIQLLKQESDEKVIKGSIIGLANVQDEALIGPMIEALKAKDKKIIVMAIDTINDRLPTKVRLEMKKALRSLL